MAKKNKKRGKSYVCIRLTALTLPPWCYLPLSCFLGPVSFDVGLYLVAGQASFFFIAVVGVKCGSWYRKEVDYYATPAAWNNAIDSFLVVVTG